MSSLGMCVELRAVEARSDLLGPSYPAASPRGEDAARRTRRRGSGLKGLALLLFRR